MNMKKRQQNMYIIVLGEVEPNPRGTMTSVATRLADREIT